MAADYVEQRIPSIRETSYREASLDRVHDRLILLVRVQFVRTNPRPVLDRLTRVIQEDEEFVSSSKLPIISPFIHASEIRVPVRES
jgi:hypothetical protein